MIGTAVYGCLSTWARQMGRDDLAELLEDTLEEEKQADKSLSQIATSGINENAAALSL
jgi:ferritin-like metal-binding protein YciE